MSATFTLNFFRSGINFNKWGSFQLPGLLNFGEFKVKKLQKYIKDLYDMHSRCVDM